MPLRAIVLDFDGVIVESESAKTEAFADVFARYPEHYEAMLAFHAQHPSAPRREKFAQLAALLGREGDVALVDALGRAFADLVRVRIDAAPYVRGALALIDRFGERVHLYVASATPEDEVRRSLAARGILSRFIKVFGDPPTPKTVALGRIVAGEGGDPTGVVFIGDSPADLAAAREHGIRFLARYGGIAFPAPAPALHRDLVEVSTTLNGLDT
jgi:phosphoglycolate phosphatase-like HAD superfamily hydrolase